MRIYYDLFSKVHIGFTRTHPHDALDIIITTDLNPRQFSLKFKGISLETNTSLLKAIQKSKGRGKI